MKSVSSTLSATFWPVEGKLFSQKAWVRVTAVKAADDSQIAKIDAALSISDSEIVVRLRSEKWGKITMEKLKEGSFRDDAAKEAAFATIYRAELIQMKSECQFVEYDEVIDTSVLKEGVTNAPVYSKEPYFVLLQKAVLSIITTPFYLVGTIAYYLLRIVPVSIFIFGAALTERIKWGSPDSRKYHFVEIPKEMGYSLWQIVISPYYALGYLSGLLISIVLPMSGWKIATSFERKWSGDVPKSQAYWIPPPVKGCDFKWLDTRHHAHGPQCRHPVATAIYQDGQLDHIETLMDKVGLNATFPSEAEARGCLPAGCER
ncbi:MAG: hypothetical protein KR126chlam2_00952 [Chlamydiae bacterium]|nr:hypothetical protein [Chlamydiota bacterium]